MSRFQYDEPLRVGSPIDIKVRTLLGVIDRTVADIIKLALEETDPMSKVWAFTLADRCACAFSNIAEFVEGAHLDAEELALPEEPDGVPEDSEESLDNEEVTP